MRIRWAVLLGCIAITAGCGGKQIPFDLGTTTGNWQVQFVADVSGAKRTGGGFLGQVGQGVTGGFVLAGQCAGSGNITGTVDRRTVTLTLGQTGEKFAMLGVLSKDNSTMSGTYSTTVTNCGDGTIPETGTWTATQVQPVQGSYSATFTSSQGLGTVHLAGTLTQQLKPNGGTLAVVSGPLTSTDSTCLPSSSTPLTLNGTITGTEIAFSIDSFTQAGLGTFSGIVSLDGKTITVAGYSFPPPPNAICDAGSGVVTLQ